MISTANIVHTYLSFLTLYVHSNKLHVCAYSKAGYLVRIICSTCRIWICRFCWYHRVSTGGIVRNGRCYSIRSWWEYAGYCTRRLDRIKFGGRFICRVPVSSIRVSGRSSLVWLKMIHRCSIKGRVVLKVNGEELDQISNCAEKVFYRLGRRGLVGGSSNL